MIPIMVMILHKRHFLFYFLYLTVGSPLHPHLYCCCVDSQCLLNLWQIYSFSTTIDGGRGEMRRERERGGKREGKRERNRERKREREREGWGMNNCEKGVQCSYMLYTHRLRTWHLAIK